MITFPQLEALIWIARLGTFEKAARRLNTTQSTVTKRIQELTLSCGYEVFERRGRVTRLTDKGEVLVGLAERVLNIREEMLLLGVTEELRKHNVRVGVTEFSTQTWIPRFFRHVRRTRPDVYLDIMVNNAPSLISSLERGEIDLAVCRRLPHSEDVESLHVATVQMAWFASATSKKRMSSVADLETATLITQGRHDGSTDLFERWYQEQGFHFDRVVNADSMTTVTSLVLADCGISILPLEFIAPQIALRQLQEVTTLPRPPEVQFFIHYSRSQTAAHIRELATEARAYCNFAQVHQT
jgi:DNA-binding transcriptional LysR family regulator